MDLGWGTAKSRLIPAIGLIKKKLEPCPSLFTLFLLKDQFHEDFAVLSLNSVLKSLLWGLNHKQNASEKLQRKYQMKFVRHG